MPILEVSADLAERQRERLERRCRRRCVSGWSGSTDLPERPVRGVVLANEVLDALPCQRFVVGAAASRELGVAARADGSFVERAAYRRCRVGDCL